MCQLRVHTYIFPNYSSLMLGSPIEIQKQCLHCISPVFACSGNLGLQIFCLGASFSGGNEFFPKNVTVKLKFPIKEIIDSTVSRMNSDIDILVGGVK